MNKHILRSKIKSTGVAYLLWFLIGFHFAYLNKWLLQILYWLTLGGLGIWVLIELFLIPGRVEGYNAEIYAQIDEIEKRERSDDMIKLHMMTKGTAPSDLSMEEKARLFDQSRRK
jgi:hypothetical protein